MGWKSPTALGPFLYQIQPILAWRTFLLESGRLMGNTTGFQCLECGNVRVRLLLRRRGIGLLAFCLHILEASLTGTEIQVCLYLFMLFPPPHFACLANFCLPFGSRLSCSFLGDACPELPGHLSLVYCSSLYIIHTCYMEC